VMDFHDVEAAVQPLIDRVDHQLLNEVPGLENPTAELIGAWLWERLAPQLPALCCIKVWENPRSHAVIRG